MQIEIRKVAYEEKSILRNLIELYKYDFSQYDHGDVNDYGRYEYKFLDHYWTEEGRHPYFLKVNQKLAGFGLIRELGKNKQHLIIHSMAEFFILKKYRNQGLGRRLALDLFERHKGEWRVGQYEKNDDSTHFWTKVIKEYTNTHFQVIREENWEGPIHSFKNVEE